MITQASSEHSICVVVPEDQGDIGLRAVREAFELELSRDTINSVSLLKGMSVVAIIGEGMAFTPGVSATFMRALFTAGVNIRAIAQGSSERQVSAVVTREDVTRALRSVHGAFTLSGKVCSVAVIGCSGKVGTEFLKQLHGNADRVKDLTDLRTRVIVCADSKRMVTEERGINPDHAQKLVQEGEPLDLDKLTSFMAHDINPTRVIVDLTDSDDVAGRYAEWLSKGIQVVTASKAVGAGPYERFQETTKAAAQSGSQWAAECSVGAALPLVNTIRDLSYTGDEVKAVEGVFSGTVTYLASAMEKGVPFEEALQEAYDLGFTEPDPRNDLNGLDVARKLVILGRELGMKVSVEDVEVESVISDELAAWEPTDRKELVKELVAKIKGGAGKSFEERVVKAHEAGKRIRQVGVVNVVEGTLKVEVQEVDENSRYGQLLESDNAICITSARYSNQPLVVQGAGAGSVLTASAVYADLLRVSRTN
jgi:aspartokinase/homoserine dehydrogenase 1